MEVEGDIAFDVGSETFVSICCSRVIESTLGAGINIGIGTTLDGEAHITFDGSHVGATVDFVDIVVATFDG